MTFPVQVGAPSITINRDDRFLVCQPDARILGAADDGFFSRDTRFISGYELRVNGRRRLAAVPPGSVSGSHFTHVCQTPFGAIFATNTSRPFA